jgi:predicted nucleotidyltransferase
VSSPLFVDVTEQAGLNWQHRSGGPEKWHILEAKGGGAAFLDYDGDGYLDIYLVNGSSLEEAGEGPPRRNALYRNLGNGSFSEVTTAAGVGDTGWGMGSVAADYDNDGDTDLYITNYGPNRLYRNEGNGRFTDVTLDAGVGDPQWSTGAAFGDYDLDGDLDLYVANYVDFDPDLPRQDRPFCQWKSVNVFCGPRSLRGAADRLYRNEGNGRFADVTLSAGVEDRHKYYGFAVLFGDYNLDGWPDLFIANDSTPNLLYRNEGNGNFRDVSLEAGVAYNSAGEGQAGMGAAFGDYDGDGFPDLFVTNFASDYNSLYHNEAGRFFLDVTMKAGLGDKSLPYVGWGACFIDYEHDGDLDLFVVNGHVYPQIDQLQLGKETYRQPNQLFENKGDGTFGELKGIAALQQRQVSRGSCYGDYDNDGDLDLLVLNLDDHPTLLRNDGAVGHWLMLRLIGQKSNRDGVGARITVFSGGGKQVREVIAGSSFLGGHDPRVHFGLASRSIVDSLEVRWPSGTIDRLYGLAADHLIVLQEGGKVN